jgi:hypothetical protein
MSFTASKGNELDYVFKKNAAGVTKTDDVNVTGGRILSANEGVPTASFVYADGVWTESETLKLGPTVATTTDSSLGGGVKVARSAFNGTAFTKLTSVWATGSIAGTSSGNTNLRGVTWLTGIKNWIPPYFGAQYGLVFYAVPRTQGFTGTQFNNGSPLPTVAQQISGLLTPYVFDYTTGILTFTDAAAGGTYGGSASSPAVKVGPASWNLCSGSANVTTYDIYMTTGYYYTGATLTTFTGSGGASTDIDIIKNIGRRAWIEGATGSISFDTNSSQVSHNLTFFGNSTNYTVIFGYGTFSSTPNLGTGDAIYQYPGPPGLNGSYNNNRNIANGYPHDTVTFGPYQITSPSSETVNVPVTIHTNVAGGTGTSAATSYGGSRFVFTIPLTMSAVDLMGAPGIYAYTATFTITGTYLAVDGWRYYTTGATVTIPAAALRFNNIWNNANLIGAAPAFNTGSNNTYITFSTGNSDQLYHLNEYTTDIAFSLRTPEDPGVSPSGFGDVYYNNTSIPLSVNGGTIGATIKNLKGLTTGVGLFPNSNTWTGGQTSIGYLGAHPGTAEVNVQTGPGIIASVVGTIKRLSMTGTPAGTPPVPAIPSGVSSISAPSTFIPSTKDAIYDPIGNAFSQEDFITGLGTTYILPTQTQDTASIFTGNKFLVLSISNNASIPSFTWQMTGKNGQGLTIINMSVYWYGPTLPNQKWYTAVKDSTNVSNTAAGCGGGFNNTSGTISYNTTDATAYTDYYKSNSPSGTQIFICIEFTGNISVPSIIIG